MSPDAVTQNRERWALFLDVNAALGEVAEMPQRLHVFERIKQLLVTLTVRLDGAVALISDRSLDDVDRVFSPLRFCVAGLHGCEYREANGCVTRTPLHSEQLMEAREKLDALVHLHPDLRLEDKGYGLAINFRLAPHLEEVVHRAAEALCCDLGAQFAVEPGSCSVEILPASCTTATLISLFMQQAPFARRIPVFVGDNTTSNSVFDVVNGFGGVLISVGSTECTAENDESSRVEDMVRWLEHVATHQPGCS